MKHSACHPEGLLSFPSVLEHDCQTHRWVSSHGAAPSQAGGQKKGRKTPRGLAQSFHGGLVLLFFLRSPSLQTPGPCLGWSVPSLGLCTSAELGGLSKDGGERPGAGSTLRADSRLRAAACGVHWSCPAPSTEWGAASALGLVCMRPLPENVEIGGLEQSLKSTG